MKALVSLILLVAATAGAQVFQTMDDFERAVRVHLANAGHTNAFSVGIGYTREVQPIRVSGGFSLYSWRVPGVPQPASLAPATPAQLEAKQQAAKSAALKAADRRMIKFLRDEGAIAPTDTRVTAAQLNAMFEAWDLLADAQAEKKTTKYFRLLHTVERNGGTELGVMDQP